MRTPSSHSDLVVVGGGVIGLSVAYELAGAGMQVTLLERGSLGREASWAGAGVLPPGSWYHDHPGMEALALAAGPAHERLSAELRDATGIDDEYHRCGAVYQETHSNIDHLRRKFARWRELGVRIHRDAATAETWRVPDEAQVRNPRRLEALAAACRRRGVRLVEGQAAARFEIDASGRVLRAMTAEQSYSADHYCLCAGAWTPQLAELMGVAAPGRPVRGQMLALRPQGPSLQGIVHRYPYYAVPRRDGVVLVGATVEEVHFDKSTTPAARDELLHAAVAMDPALAEACVLAHWSGLRPASPDGLPLIGRAPDVENLWLATGHHRSGLQLAPVTATIMSCLLRDAPCELPVEPWDPRRFARCVAA